MRKFNDAAIKVAQEDAKSMYAKLASYAPDEKLNRDDIRTLLFILEQYSSELRSISFGRSAAGRRAKK